jgi:Ca2+-binding RTX toxin-like protein
MRRVLLLLVVAAAVLALAGGTVLSAPVGCGGGDCVGTRGADTITGSSGLDRIAGMEGNDTINGGMGPDDIYGDEGNDTISHSDASVFLAEATIFGDEGNDTIDVRDGGGQDSVDCGPGKKDKVTFDQGIDIIRKNCEIKKTQ